MAAWDITGKLRQQSLYNMWKLDPSKGPKTDFTIGIDTIEKMIAKIDEKPWPIYKIKLGSSEDIAIMKALRQHTDAVFRVDANAGWTLGEARQILPVLKELGVEFVEQPLAKDNWEGMQVLYKESPLPLIADESCITPARRMITAAREAGMKVMVGSMNESTVGSAAIAHLLPYLDYVDMDGPLLLREDLATGINFDHGSVQIPRGPGLGVTFTGLYDKV
jgi:L-alanine-DL-glutamate epimerase-like enolase superfamily enzyme